MRKRILVGIMFLLFVSLVPIDQASTLVTVKIEERPATILSDYVVHDPILITSDEDFETQGWSGSGSVNEPYVIEGISVNAARGGHCIEIRNTTVNFIVRNCYLSHYGDEWVGGTHASTGVRLFNSTHGTIENNTFETNGIGVYILASNNTQVIDNDLSEIYEDAIIASVSSNVTISNNVCDSNSFSIYFSSVGWNPREGVMYTGISNNITIVNNIVMSDRVGIEIWDCISGIIMNNTAFNNDYYWDTVDVAAETNGANFGIYDSENFLITNNTGIAKGLSISIWGSSNISVVENSFTSLEFLHPAYDKTRMALFDYNYYSTYDGIDEDNDGIGDTTYFDLYGYIQDDHPLMYYPWYEPVSPISSDPTLLLIIGGVSLMVIVTLILWFKRT